MASCRASARYIACIAWKLKTRSSSRRPPRPKKSRCWGGGRFTSPSRIGVAAPAAEVGAQVRQQLVRILDRPLRKPGRLDQEGHGVHPEAGQALLRPEARDLGDLVPHLRVGDVEVGLLGVEAVQIPLARLLVVRPVRVLLVGEDDVARLLLRLVVAPDVEVAIGRVARGPRLLEPRVADRRVVDDQVGDDPDAAVLRGAHHLGEVAERAELRVHGVEVDDVVAVVALGRGVERHEPDAGDADPREVVDALDEPRQVAAAVAVAVEERLDVEAVDDPVLPPEVARGLLPGHVSAGRT